jgi:hypothetical protein
MVSAPHSEMATPMPSARRRCLPRNSQEMAMVAIGMKELSSTALVAAGVLQRDVGEGVVAADAEQAEDE